MTHHTRASASADAPKHDYRKFLLNDFAAHLNKRVEDIISDTAEQFFYDDTYLENWAKRKEQAKALIETCLLPLNRQHALINVSGAYGVADFRSLEQPLAYNPDIERAWTPRAMPDMHGLKDFDVRFEDRSVTVISKGKYVSKKATHVWREWRYRRVYQRGFLLAPGIEQKDLPECYNTWAGWGIEVDTTEEQRPEAWATLRKHIEEAYFEGNKRNIEWFYSWLSDMFTNPMSKPESAIVLRGSKGAGKSLMADVMHKLIGPRHFARLDKPSQLTGQFNGHLAPTILVDVEEAFFSGSKEAEGILKSWITSEDVQIRLMRTDGYMARNFSRFMFTSNSEWVIPATQDERRFFVIDVSEKFRGNKEHFEMLHAELKLTGGYEEFFKFLLTWKKPAWVQLNQPPKTQALSRQVEESLSIPERFFWNAVKTGDRYPMPDGGEFYRSEVHAAYVDWVSKHGSKYDATNDRKFATLMDKYWHVEKLPRRVDRKTGNKETVYKAMPLGDLRTLLMDEMSLHDDAFDCDDDEEFACD
ncbi:MAG: hypothetical protein EOO38_01985 [Cytophagaceae bacterium]|nr:MAG: hypothetical protein EOO38_01985 [Cytophagaceae bacterium]